MAHNENIQIKQGATWTLLTDLGKRSWTSAAASADGSVLAIAAYAESIYTSTDGGDSWTSQVGAGTQPWQALALSFDGAKFVSGTNPGYIYTFDTAQAEDGWVKHDDILGSRSWRGLAASNDGSVLWAATTWSILKSVDSGSTWTAVDSAGYLRWNRVACSSDGSRVVASPEYGFLHFTSNNVSAGRPHLSRNLCSCTFVLTHLHFPTGRYLVGPIECGIPWLVCTGVLGRLQHNPGDRFV